MRRRAWSWGCMAAVSAAFVVAGCGSDDSDTSSTGGPATGQVVKVGTGPVANQGAYYLGVEKGFFADEGIEPESTHVPTGASSIALLLNGQLDLAFGGPDGAIAAISTGVPVTLVGAFWADRKPPNEQVGTMVKANSPIKSWKDLEGKTVALNSLQCCWHFWVREAVAKDGGDSSKVKFVQIPFADQLSALEQDRVQAVTTLQPFIGQAKADGHRSLGDAATIAFGDRESVPAATIAARSFVEKNPEAVAAFQRAMTRSAEYANAHPEEVYPVVAEVTGAPLNVLKKVPLPSFTADLKRDSLEKEAELMEKYGAIEELPPYEEMVWEGGQG